MFVSRAEVATMKKAETFWLVYLKHISESAALEVLSFYLFLFLPKKPALKSREKLFYPSLPHFDQKALFRGGVYLEAPRSRNLYAPPSFIRPPPLEGSLQRWGVGGV